MVSSWSGVGFPRFLSTPSARRATGALRGGDDPLDISIHALREEGDALKSCKMQKCAISIHALREEGDRQARSGHQVAQDISIHALREEGDGDAGHQIDVVVDISIHALREEGDFESHRCEQAPDLFLSTPSARRATTRLLGGAIR